MFSAIKWIGVGYLVWLGLNALFASAGRLRVGHGRRARASALFLQGAIIEFANPKALLYFAAILPQFLDVEAAILPQVLVMGATTFLIDVTSYSAYACLGARLTRGGVKDWLVRLVNRTAGLALLYAGFRMASVTVTR